MVIFKVKKRIAMTNGKYLFAKTKKRKYNLQKISKSLLAESFVEGVSAKFSKKT